MIGVRVRAFAIALATAGVFGAAPAQADLYGFVDGRGVAHYSDRPLDPRYRLLRRDRPPAALNGSSSVIYTVRHRPPRIVEIDPKQRARFAPLVRAIAEELRLNPALLHAVITVESGYNPRARSPRGASGLMQLMPATARRYAVRDIWDPRQNIEGGARYLRDLLGLFGNDLSLALAAYNAGENAVIRHGHRIPPFRETREYVPKVLEHYRALLRALHDF